MVGIGLRFAGSDSPETFWQQILEQRSGICQVPAERWENLDYYYDPDPKAPDKSYSRIRRICHGLQVRAHQVLEFHPRWPRRWTAPSSSP